MKLGLILFQWKHQKQLKEELYGMFFSIYRFIAISAFHTQSKSKKMWQVYDFFLCFLLVVWGEICTKHTAYDLDIAQFLIYFSEFAGKGTTNIRNSVKRVDISVNRVVII